MEDLKMALREHADLASDLFGRFSSELRRGFAPAVDSFLGFFNAVLWKEPSLIGLLTFEVVLLLMIIITRRKMNYQLSLLILALSGVCFVETMNIFLGMHWRSSRAFHFGPLVRSTSYYNCDYSGEYPFYTLWTDSKMEESITQTPR